MNLAIGALDHKDRSYLCRNSEGFAGFQAFDPRLLLECPG